MITDFHFEVQRWRTGEVIRLSWGYDGKVVRAVLLAKSGARYVPEKPPDDELLEFLMEHFGMKKAAARIMARKLPKGTEEERVRAAYGLYEREAKV